MTQRISTRIVEEVATHHERPPAELPPLFETVEVDALDRLVARLPDEPLVEAVEFSYAGTCVTVLSDGGVRVATQ